MLPVFFYSIVEYTHVIRVQSPAVNTGLDHTLHYQSLTVCVVSANGGGGETIIYCQGEQSSAVFTGETS